MQYDDIQNQILQAKTNPGEAVNDGQKPKK